MVSSAGPEIGVDDLRVVVARERTGPPELDLPHERQRLDLLAEAVEGQAGLVEVLHVLVDVEVGHGAPAAVADLPAVLSRQPNRLDHLSCELLAVIVIGHWCSLSV